MICPHMQAEAQTPAVFPWDPMALAISVTKSQLLAALCPLQEHPLLGLVSTSIQTLPQRLGVTWAKSSFTCVVPLFPLQGNMYTSVESPAALAFWRLATAWESYPPQEQYPLGMAKVTPLFFIQVKVEVEKGWEISTPLTAKTLRTREVRRRVFNMLKYYDELSPWERYSGLVIKQQGHKLVGLRGDRSREGLLR